MKHSILPFFFAAFVAYFTTAGLAQVTDVEPDERQRELLVEPCQIFEDEARRGRCEHRNIQRWKATTRHRSADEKEENMYDRIDFHKGYMRRALVERQRQKLWNLSQRERVSYRHSFPTNNVNTQRLDFLNTYYEERLACMSVPHGRQRKVCLERAAQQLRERQRDPYRRGR